MAKPPPPSHSVRQFQFGDGHVSAGRIAPRDLTITGPAPLSRNLLMSDPEFGGCKWPTGGENEPPRFCCAAAKGRFCAPHRKAGIVAIPNSGKGSVAELLRMAERLT